MGNVKCENVLKDVQNDQVYSNTRVPTQVNTTLT